MKLFMENKNYVYLWKNEENKTNQQNKKKQKREIVD